MEEEIQEKIREVYDSLTISPLSREEILAILEEVRRRVESLPVVTVVEG